MSSSASAGISSVWVSTSATALAPLASRAMSDVKPAPKPLVTTLSTAPLRVTVTWPAVTR